MAEGSGKFGDKIPVTPSATPTLSARSGGGRKAGIQTGDTPCSAATTPFSRAEQRTWAEDNTLCVNLCSWTLLDCRTFFPHPPPPPLLLFISSSFSFRRRFYGKQRHAAENGTYGRKLTLPHVPCKVYTCVDAVVLCAFVVISAGSPTACECRGGMPVSRGSRFTLLHGL